jgi:Recombination endonuclease VII
MRCSRCGLDKDPEDFPRNKNTRSGRHCYCKLCHNAQVRASVKKNHGGYRHYRLKHKYGIGAADVDRMIAEQGGMCPICRKRPAVHVDHDHRTGKVRAIVCEMCNGGLGQFKDSPQFIRNAIAYIEMHTTKQQTEES